MIVYNPKFITVNGRKTLNTTDIKDFTWSHVKWSLKAGEMLKFPDDVGHAILRQITFTEEVKKDNYDRIKKEIEEKKFKCDKCSFETNTPIAYVSHSRTHEKENALENTDGIKEAQPIGEYRGPAKDIKNPEEEIPKGGTKFNPVEDRDGVGWYGEGMKRDTSN